METDHTLNRWYLIAGALLGLTVLVHIFVGGPESYRPLRASALDPIALNTLSVVWHMASWVMLVLTVALCGLARSANPRLHWVVLACLLGFAGLFVGYGMLVFGSLWILPQWVVFASIAALMEVALWRG